MLYCELINNINNNYQQQINWIIEKLEEIKEKAEKAKLFYLDRKESSPDILNFIEKKAKQRESKYQHKKEKIGKL